MAVRGDLAMAEEVLDVPEVGSPLKKVRRALARAWPRACTILPRPLHSLPLIHDPNR